MCLLLRRGNLQIRLRILLALEFTLGGLWYLFSVLIFYFVFTREVFVFDAVQLFFQILYVALQLLVVGVQLVILRDYVSCGLLHPIYLRSQRYYLLLFRRVGVV